MIEHEAADAEGKQVSETADTNAAEGEETERKAASPQTAEELSPSKSGSGKASTEEAPAPHEATEGVPADNEGAEDALPSGEGGEDVPAAAEVAEVPAGEGAEDVPVGAEAAEDVPEAAGRASADAEAVTPGFEQPDDNALLAMEQHEAAVMGDDFNEDVDDFVDDYALDEDGEYEEDGGDEESELVVLDPDHVCPNSLEFNHFS